MDVILLEKIRRLGDMGETVKVKPGYGRNFLLPQGKALPATDANRSVFEARKTELTKRAAESVNAAKIRAEKIAGQVLNIKVLASEEGKLYGSVNVSEVLDAANEVGLGIERNEIVMPTPIREIGRFDIAISLHSEVETSITVVVESKRAAQNDD
jgi:large subunit ribosomal protein L9